VAATSWTWYLKPSLTVGGLTLSKDWIPVSKQPTIKEIDYSKTSDEMLFKNRAVLKDGSKVSWN
jgi:hypothetical protein